MHGAREKHEIFHISWVLALRIEDLQRRGEDFSGSSVDRREFFDLLSREICGTLLEKMGMPTQIAEAQKLAREWVSRYSD